jgi:hypothetical protein
MLKTIRKRIVGMMNTLRIARSLQPLAAAREPGSRLVIAFVAKRFVPCDSRLGKSNLPQPRSA